MYNIYRIYNYMDMTIHYFYAEMISKILPKSKLTNLDIRCTEIQLMVSPPYQIYHQIGGMIIWLRQAVIVHHLPDVNIQSPMAK